MGAPYTNLGSLRLQHINFASFSSAPYSATPLAVLGILSTDGAAMTKTFNVVAPVVDDYANEGTRGGRSQYRLEFAVATNGDALKDLTYFTRLGFKLRLKYDVP